MAGIKVTKAVFTGGERTEVHKQMRMLVERCDGRQMEVMDCTTSFLPWHRTLHSCLPSFSLSINFLSYLYNETHSSSTCWMSETVQVLWAATLHIDTILRERCLSKILVTIFFIWYAFPVLNNTNKFKYILLLFTKLMLVQESLEDVLTLRCTAT